MRIQFSIENLEYEDDTVLVDGRCCNGPINRGDKFESIFDITIPITDDRCGPAIIGKRTPVSLFVKKIIAYNHDFDALDEGLTARLTLYGHGIGNLRIGMVIGSE